MHIEATETIEGNYESIADFRAKHPNGEIQYIDEKAVMGFCEFCGCPLFDGEGQSDIEGVMCCQSCLDKIDMEAKS